MVSYPYNHHMKRLPAWLLLLFVIVTAFVFRFSNLESAPPGLYPDEAVYANDGLNAARTGDFKTYYPNNNGREGFYISALGIVLNLFGAHIWVIRAFVGAIGVGAVIAIWFLAKQLFQNERIALWSAFFAATGFWVVNFSRIGFRATLVPFLVAISFAFLWRGLKHSRISDFILAGLFFGLGFHTYIAFRFAPFILIALLLFYWWETRRQNAAASQSVVVARAPCRFCLNVLIFLAVTFIVALPIGWYYLNNPQDFFGRAAGVSVFATEQPIKEFLLGTVKTLGQFNIRGDYNWRHNFSGSPQLLYPVGVLFLWGVMVTITKLKNYKRTLGTPYQFSAYGFLAVGFIMMMFPSTLTAEGLPHALRTIGMIPFVMILAGIGAEGLYQWLARRAQRWNMSMVSVRVIIAVCVIAISAFEFHKYFIAWATRPETKDAFSNYFVEIGRTMRELPVEAQKYIIVNQDGVLVDGVPMPAQTVKFVADGVENVHYLVPNEIQKLLLPRNAFVIPLHFNDEIRNALLSRFGGLKTVQNNKGVYMLTP